MSDNDRISAAHAVYARRLQIVLGTTVGVKPL